MSDNRPSRKKEVSPGREKERSVSSSETSRNRHPRRPERKFIKRLDPYKNISRQSSASPPSSPAPRDRRSDNQSFHTLRRTRRRSRSSSTSEAQSSRSSSPKPNSATRGHKRGLVALGGLLAAGLPIAGELYLKHKIHEHEREKDERKEVRHEQAMEEKERKKMDLELQAMEEETEWMSRKHGIDIRRREVELQIRELERDDLRAERRPNGGMAWLERGRNAASRADVASPTRLRRVRTAIVDAHEPPHHSSEQSRGLGRNSSLHQVDWQDRPIPNGQQQWKRRRRPRDDLQVTYLNPGPLPPRTSSDRILYATSPSPPYRKKSTSPNIRKQQPPTSAHLDGPHAFPTTSAILAGSLTAFRLRNEDGPWLGKKALRIAASAGTAALASISLNRGETPHREREDRLVEHVAEGVSRGVALPVMAGIGAERIFWDETR
jgi:hypothetical protein